MSHFLAGGQIQFGGAFSAGRFAQGRFPGETASIGMDVQDSEAGFAPAGASVFDDGDSGA